MKIAAWNVNSIRARLPVALDWLDQARPEIALLQETKVTPEQFPGEPFEERGYNVVARGEAGGRNGVAILAKRPIEDVRERLPGDDDDEEARYLEAVAELPHTPTGRIAKHELARERTSPEEDFGDRAEAGAERR